ncbi:MAG: hypothetical protein IKY39_01120 [Clostridia bacterium]|nr:hypothetical protein [Clostridia bacterium]
MGNKKRKFADDGWALWIDGDDRSTIYLNEWINPKGRSYVDISVRVYGARETKTVNFFIPFAVERNEVTDLSYMLADSSALRALFNTNGNVDSEKTKYTSELRYDNRTVSLINIADDFTTVKKVSYGTVITVDFNYIKEFITSDEAYLIFRIPHKTLDKIFAPSINVTGLFDKINSLIQSPIISEKYGYSIRINEARLLPPEINEIEDLQEQRIRKALVTISLGDEYEMNESACYRIRRLEAELNRNYAPKGYDCTDAITYQWVEERDFNMKAHYNFYFTMEHNSVSKMSMLVYLLIVFCCGALGSAIYDLFKLIFGLL